MPFCIWRPVTTSSGGESKLEMKEKTVASFESAQFDDTIKKPITDDDVAAVVILETPISGERPVEEEGTYALCVSLPVQSHYLHLAL